MPKRSYLQLTYKKGFENEEQLWHTHYQFLHKFSSLNLWMFSSACDCVLSIWESYRTLHSVCNPGCLWPCFSRFLNCVKISNSKMLAVINISIKTEDLYEYNSDFSTPASNWNVLCCFPHRFFPFPFCLYFSVPVHSVPQASCPCWPPHSSLPWILSSGEFLWNSSHSLSLPWLCDQLPFALTAVASLIVKHSTCSHESCCRLVLVGAMSGMKSLTSLEAKTILSEQQLLFLNPQDTYQ